MKKRREKNSQAEASCKTLDVARSFFPLYVVAQGTEQCWALARGKNFFGTFFSGHGLASLDLQP